MPVAHINDINLYYEVHGEGFPIVCIAGLSADHMAWINLLEPLAQKYKVILLDNRGAGQSDVPPGPYSIQQMSNDVYGLCQYLGIEQALVMGSSMGGFITQQLMHQYPQFVRASIITNSTQKSRASCDLFFEGMLELIKSKAPASSCIKLVLSLLYSSDFLSVPGRIEELIQLRLNYPYAITEAGMQAQILALKGFDSSSWAHEINIPTLVLGSDEDLIFDEASMKALAHAIPKAQYHSFSRVGHLPHQEIPQEFMRVVDEFLQPLLA
ncbi:MAG: alpha/beta fold hydrolase [Gammaproteobacteria bacterium]|nr:alpha/beta fold hydrolase [Gammaproteobacteria bacterium]